MARQLFSTDVRGSRRGGGAVPLSLVIHAVAAGALLLAAGNRPAETQEVPPLGPVVMPGAQTPTPVPTAATSPVRVGHKSGRRGTSSGAYVPQPAATAAVPDPEIAAAPQPDERPMLPFGHDACPGCPVGEEAGTQTGGDDQGGGDGDPVRISELEAPRRIHTVMPVYPRPAIPARIEGAVRVDCVIGPDGRVRDARAVGGHPILRAAAVVAVRQWVYSPPRLGGHPVSVLLTVTVHFRLTRA